MASHQWMVFVAASFGLLACGLSVEGIPAGSSSTAGSGAAGNGGGVASSSVGASTSATSASTSSSVGVGGGGAGGAPGCAAGFQCVAAASAGEYVRVASGDGLSCPPGWTAPVTYGDGNDPGCTGCSCDPPTGGTCTAGVVSGSLQADCTPMLGTLGFAAGVCHDFNANVQALLLYESTASAASCTAGPSAPVPLALSTLCTPEAPVTSCGNGVVCVPDGDAAFDQVCNLLPASAACDAAWSDATNVATFLDDDRSCACSCGAPVGQGCTGATLTYWSNDSCTNAPLGTLPGDGICHPTAAATSGSMMKDAGSWVGGTCTGSQSGSGGVTFGPPQKLCCLP
jgi:hypothetical protein